VGYFNARCGEHPASGRLVRIERANSYNLSEKIHVELLSLPNLSLIEANLIKTCLLVPIVRSHWAIENSLHWVMDMMFRGDECRVRNDRARANFTPIKHTAPYDRRLH